MTTVFESLQKAFAKAKTVVEKEGATPRFYIRSLVELEDFVKEVCTCVCVFVHVVKGELSAMRVHCSLGRGQANGSQFINYSVCV